MSAHSQTAISSQHTPVEVADLNPRHSSEPLISSVAHGDRPTTVEVNMAINHAKDAIDYQRHHSDINRKGDQLAQDTQDVLNRAQVFLNTHNQDGKISDLIQHSKEARLEAKMEAATLSHTTGGLGLSHHEKHVMKKEARNGLDYGRNLALFIFRSSEFKSVLIEAIEFIQNILLDGVVKVNLLGESLKSDIAHDDVHIHSTRTDAHSLRQEATDIAHSKAHEWNEVRRHELYTRFRVIVDRASRQPEFQKLIRTLFKWMDILKRRACFTKDKLENRVDMVRDRIHQAEYEETAFDKVMADIRAIVDEFAGVGSWDMWSNNTWNLYVELLHDAEASQFFDDLRHYVTFAMDHPDQLNLEAQTREGNMLMDRGRTLMQSEKYRAKFERMFDSTKFLLIKIKNDESTQLFKESLKKWGEHFALDSQGRPDLYVIQESLVQLKNLAYPVIREKLGNLRIGRIVGSNEKVDYSIEDLVVSVPDLLPRSFELQTKTDLQVDFDDLTSRQGYVKASMDLRRLKPYFKNVKFWYKKKSFPKLEDHGVIDVDLSAGSGTRIKIVWKIVTEPSSHKSHPFSFSLVNVKCTVDKMDVVIRDAKHSVLDKIATSLFIGKIKSSVAQSIVDGIVHALQPISDQMNNWFATRPVHSIKDRANDRFHEAFDRTNSAIKEHPMDHIKDQAHLAVASAKGAMLGAKETLELKADDMRDSLHEIKVEAQSEMSKSEIKSTGYYGLPLDESEYTNKEWHFEWYSVPPAASNIKVVEAFPTVIESEPMAQSMASTHTVVDSTPMMDSMTSKPNWYQLPHNETKAL